MSSQITQNGLRAERISLFLERKNQMPTEVALPHGVMEGKGAYNKYAMFPGAGSVLALPHLENAVRSIELDLGDHAVVIADYGSSQGKNSMLPMETAIKGLRQRLGSSRPILVFHIDQPSNDFNVLFEVLHADPNRYALDDPSVFSAAIGRSFYGSVLPPGSVTLGWSSFAAVWLSRVPTVIPGHFTAIRATGAVREEFERQAAKDWEAFLSLRSRELQLGGRLVVVLPGRGDDGATQLEHFMDEANEVLGEMAGEGAITSKERARMVLGTYPRRKADLLAPFASNGQFEGLCVEDSAMFELTDPAWADYERDGAKEALAARHALFFRSIFMPSLASALDRVRSGDAEAIRIFADRLEGGLKQRLARQPRAIHTLVQAIVLAKRV